MLGLDDFIEDVALALFFAAPRVWHAMFSIPEAQSVVGCRIVRLELAGVAEPQERLTGFLLFCQF